MQAITRQLEIDPKKMSPAAIRAFFGLADKWKLSLDEQRILLGRPGKSTLYKWKQKGGILPHDTLVRISNLLAIFKSLHVIFTDQEAADAWVRRPNDAPPFNGSSAIHYMLHGDITDINDVRRYLDAQRGAWA